MGGRPERRTGVTARNEIANRDMEAFKEMVSLFEAEARADDDPKRVALKLRAARLLENLLPKDPGFVVGDRVEVSGDVMFISSQDNGITTIAVSDIQRIYVATRHVHKAAPATLSSAITKLLEGAREYAQHLEAMMAKLG
jgi:hypothetical protein